MNKLRCLTTTNIRHLADSNKNEDDRSNIISRNKKMMRFKMPKAEYLNRFKAKYYAQLLHSSY